MQHEFISATKRLQQELDDPDLKVVFDDETQEYQILKYIQTGCDRGYYSMVEQARYKEWNEPQVIYDFKAGDYRTLDPKKLCYNLKLQKEQAEKKNKEEFREGTKEIFSDIYRYYMHPGVVSIPGIKGTRLQGR